MFVCKAVSVIRLYVRAFVEDEAFDIITFGKSTKKSLDSQLIGMYGNGLKSYVVSSHFGHLVCPSGLVSQQWCVQTRVAQRNFETEMCQIQHLETHFF